MKQYIFSALCLVSGAFCLSSCNDDKEARPYTPDYEIVPEYTNADTWKAYEAFNEHLLDPLFVLTVFDSIKTGSIHSQQPVPHCTGKSRFIQ